MSAAPSLSAPPNRNRLATALKCLLLAGAALLLAGVLLYSWAELRTASWMLRASSKPALLIPSDDETADDWHLRLASIDRQHFWAGEILFPLGAGMLFGSLTGFVFLPNKRFRLSTLFLAILYLALLLGIPFGLVRPHLQNPRLSFQRQPIHIRFTQSKPNKFDPKWQSLSQVPLFQLKSLPLVLLPFLLIPLAVFLLPRFRRRTANA